MNGAFMQGRIVKNQVVQSCLSLRYIAPTRYALLFSFINIFYPRFRVDKKGTDDGCTKLRLYAPPGILRQHENAVHPSQNITYHSYCYHEVNK